MTITLLIVESQPLVRLGLRTAAEQGGEIVLVGEASNGAEGLRLFRENKPDVTVLNLRLPDFCAADDLNQFFSVNSKAKIIVLAESAGDAEITSTIEQGAAGFVTELISPEEFLNAIRKVANGSKFIPRDVANTISGGLPYEKLTIAESTVLNMLVGGMSNKEIAFALDVSDNTIKTHVRHIFEKLGVSDRTSATVTAIKRGLVRVDL